MIIIHQGPELTLENENVEYIGNWYDFPVSIQQYNENFAENDRGYHKVEINGDIIISISKCKPNNRLGTEYIEDLRRAFEDVNFGEIYMYIHRNDMLPNNSLPDLGVADNILYFSGCSPLSVISEYGSKKEFVEICKKDVNFRFQG